MPDEVLVDMFFFYLQPHYLLVTNTFVVSTLVRCQLLPSVHGLQGFVPDV